MPSRNRERVWRFEPEKPWKKRARARPGSAPVPALAPFRWAPHPPKPGVLSRPPATRGQPAGGGPNRGRHAFARGAPRAIARAHPILAGPRRAAGRLRPRVRAPQGHCTCLPTPRAAGGGGEARARRGTAGAHGAPVRASLAPAASALLAGLRFTRKPPGLLLAVASSRSTLQGMAGNGARPTTEGAAHVVCRCVCRCVCRLRARDAPRPHSPLACSHLSGHDQGGESKDGDLHGGGEWWEVVQ